MAEIPEEFEDKFENDSLPDEEIEVTEEELFADLRGTNTPPDALTDAALAERYRRWLADNPL